MTDWDGRGKSSQEDEDVNPFMKTNRDRPLSSSGDKKVETPVEDTAGSPAGEEAMEDTSEAEIAVGPEADEDAMEETQEEAEDAIDREPSEETDEGAEVVAPVDKPEKKYSSIGSALKGMVSFFTAIPVDVEEKDINSMNANMWLSPIVGFMFAMFAFVAFWFGSLGDSVTGGILAFATVLIVNKFLHVDGLIDTGDALVATGDSEKKRNAMKDSSIGAGGIAVALLVMGGTLFYYTSAGPLYVFMAVIAVAEICSRNSMAVAAAFGDHVEGGMASDSVKETFEHDIVKSTAVTAILGLVAVLISWGLFNIQFANTPLTLLNVFWAALIVAIATSVAWGWVVAKYANDKFGAVTGDVLGASVESGRLVVLILMWITLGLLA